MSELKVYEFDTEYPNDIQSGSYYDKSEADKVIAGKDETIADLATENTRLKKQLSCTFSDDCLRERQLKREVRKLKYKLCLVITRLCRWKMATFYYKKKKSDFYLRWAERWLELAEKFKPNSTAK